MDGSPSSGLEEIKPVADEEEGEGEAQAASKRRKTVQKTVVTVKVEANKNGKHKSEGPPPSDSWSWRKYGQKPIKGTPFPRGYYRCSTSKGCSAKKQVERCKTDTSMMIITYTSTHNHPSPDLSSSSITNPSSHQLSEHEQTNQNQAQSEGEELVLLPINTSKEQHQDPDQYNKVLVEEEQEHDHQQTDEEGHVFHYYSQSPFNSLIINHQREEEEDPFGENSLDRVLCNHHAFFDGGESPLSLEPSSSQLLPMEENDGSFFDELEELPMFPSSFSRLMTFVL